MDIFLARDIKTSSKFCETKSSFFAKKSGGTERRRRFSAYEGRRRREWKSIREVSSSQFHRAGAGVGFGKSLETSSVPSSLDPFSHVKREEGNLERRGERERMNFHSGLMGLNASAINRGNPLHAPRTFRFGFTAISCFLAPPPSSLSLPIQRSMHIGY